jgi:hypothetical protein
MLYLEVVMVKAVKADLHQDVPTMDMEITAMISRKM